MKRFSNKAWFVLALAVLLLGMTACGTTKIDVAEGVNVFFSGKDGHGFAEIAFSEDNPNCNTPAYFSELLEDGKVSENDLALALTILSAVTYELDQDSGLSNGDKVTVYIDVDNDVLKNYGIKGKSQELTFTVEGLDEEAPVPAESPVIETPQPTEEIIEVTTIEPFQNFEITFGGTSPEAYTEYYTQSEVIDGVIVYYSINEPEPYRDGQTITVNASLSDSEHYALSTSSMTVTVSGVSKYISDINELQSETLDAMKEKAEEVISAKITDWEFYFSSVDPEFASYELWSRREDTILGSPNTVYLYYNLNIDDNGNEFPSYYYVCFDSILQRQDGVQEVNVENYSYPSVPMYELLKDYPTLESRSEEVRSSYGEGYNIQKSS